MSKQVPLRPSRKMPPDALFAKLETSIKGAWARSVLQHRYQQPELVYLAVCSLQLTSHSEYRLLAEQNLRNLVAGDCGFFHFCREWCRVNAEGVNTETNERREDLLIELFEILPTSCQRLARNKMPPKKPSTAHRCWSLGCRPDANQVVKDLELTLAPEP